MEKITIYVSDDTYDKIHEGDFTDVSIRNACKMHKWLDELLEKAHESVKMSDVIVDYSGEDH